MAAIHRFIGNRYAICRGARHFARLVTLFGLLGMTLGVAALVVVLSVMNGFESEMRGRVDQLVAPLEIRFAHAQTGGELALSSLVEGGGVAAASPAVEQFALLSFNDRSRLIRLTGVNPSRDLQVVDWASAIRYGAVASLAAGEYAIAIGEITARQLGVTIGDRIDLQLPELLVTPAGLFPRIKRVTVGAIFTSGTQLDDELTFMHIDDARRLLMLPADSATVLRLRAEEQGTVEAQRAVDGLLTGLDYRWRRGDESLMTLYRAMQVEKVVVTLMLSAILLVAAFNIVAGLTLMVADKRPDIAILRTMGASAADVMAVFLRQALIIGGAGIVLGAAAGSTIALQFESIIGALQRLFGTRVFDPDIYYIATMPSQWRPGDLLLVVVIAAAITAVAGLFPAWRASRVPPLEALAYH